MPIRHSKQHARRPLGAALIVAITALAAGVSVANAQSMKLALSGDQEVPAVKSAGAATGTIEAGTGGLLTGSVTTTGIAGTAAHIHEGAAGKNGPVVIPLTKSGDTYTVPAGTKLTDAQAASLKAGNLYVNVHTAANPNGELRAQLKP